MNRNLLQIALVALGLFLSLLHAVRAMADTPSNDATFPVTDEVVSLNMPDVPIVDALRMVAKLAGINIVIDSRVEGAVNLYVDNVPLREAWDAILASGNLQCEAKGNLVRVYPLAGNADGQATQTQVVSLKHIPLGVQSIEERSSSGQSGSGESTQRNRRSDTSGGGRGTGDSQQEEELTIDEIVIQSFGQDQIKVAKDERTNQLVLTASPAVLKEALLLVEALDRPVAQILIEAKVLQVRSNALDTLGIHWGGVYTLKNSGSLQVSSDRATNNPGEVVAEAAKLNGQFASTLNGFDVTVSALVEQGDARVLSSPRVVTQNNKEAFISSGQEIQIPSGLDINGNASYRERQVTLELGVTPRLLSEEQINMVIRLRNDSINYSQQQISGVPPLDVNSIESMVSLRNGDAVVVGGIILKQDNYNQFRVPFLSDIPWLGKAFQYRKKQQENSELMVVIAPKVISNETGAIDRPPVDADALFDAAQSEPTVKEEIEKQQESEPAPAPKRNIRKSAAGSKMPFRNR